MDNSVADNVMARVSRENLSAIESLVDLIKFLVQNQHGHDQENQVHQTRLAVAVEKIGEELGGIRAILGELKTVIETQDEATSLGSGFETGPVEEQP